MTEGDILLALLPQSEGQRKIRPTLVLRRMPGFGDLLVCGISTQLRHQVGGFDEIVGPSDSDFGTSGLKASSLIRLGYLAALPASSFLGKIGLISSERHQRLLSRLCEHLRPGSKNAT